MQKINDFLIYCYHSKGQLFKEQGFKSLKSKIKEKKISAPKNLQKKTDSLRKLVISPPTFKKVIIRIFKIVFCYRILH